MTKNVNLKLIQNILFEFSCTKERLMSKCLDIAPSLLLALAKLSGGQKFLLPIILLPIK